MKFLDLFAGIGGFRHGLEQCGHICVGHVENNKYANKSYQAMYQLEGCKFSPERNMLCRREIKERCDGSTCKGEWFAEDINKISADEIPEAEIWTFGFPCTDISLSGRRAGLAGKRSGLFFTVIDLLQGTAAQNKPELLIIENVKHLLSSKRGGDFTTVLFNVWRAGYSTEWFCYNSKDFGVPQSRERVYLVGHLGSRCGREVLPLPRPNKASVRQLIGGRQGARVYDCRGLAVTLMSGYGGFGGKTGLYASFVNMNEGGKLTALAHGVKAKQNAGIVRHAGETSGILLFMKESFTGALQENGKDDENLYFRVRRLTPRECWRLQAFEDELFDRAKAAGVSDTQLYKQAGNAVTVNIVYEIGKRIQEEYGLGRRDRALLPMHSHSSVDRAVAANDNKETAGTGTT